MIKFKCYFADACLSDYWGGHHLPWVCVPVGCETTFADLRYALHSEIAQGAIGGNNPLIDSDSDEIYQALRKAIDTDIQPRNVDTQSPFSDLEPIGENGTSESVYAFFVFEECEDE